MKYLENFINIIYPNVCGFCGKTSNYNICKKCELLIKDSILCNIDEYKDKYFGRHIYVFKYEKFIREKLIDYKFNNKPYMYKAFAEIILKNEKIFGILQNYDIIIPVPIHKKRKLDRGYNQTELIARYLSKNINSLSVLNDVIAKSKNTVPQSSLTSKERKNNVMGIYTIKNTQEIKNKKVLIIDDIYTTGNTVNECAKMIMIGTPQLLDVITIAKD